MVGLGAFLSGAGTFLVSAAFCFPNKGLVILLARLVASTYNYNQKGSNDKFRPVVIAAKFIS